MDINNYSKLTICITLIFLIAIRVSIPNWHSWWETGSVLSWDVLGYYLYLPATFIYHDLWNVNFISGIVSKYQPTIGYYQSFAGPLGTQVMKYSMGWSILNAPFFFIADAYAKWFGYPCDGFSDPYQFAIMMAGLFYTFIGLIFLRKVLLCFFADRIASISILLIAFGTNYTEYATFGNGMTHISCFALYACLIFLTIKWHQGHSKLYAGTIGFLAGMLTIVRPSEMICIIIPILWNVWNKKSWQEKIKFIRSNPSHLALACFFGIVTVIPQLIYWKLATGQWFYYSYPNEHFTFLSPHVFDFLFSFRKGWLIYTPLMILAIIGLRILYVKRKPMAAAVILFSLLNIWILSSWSTWWYGGSFGQRSMVESYVVWSLPLAATIEWIGNRAKNWLKYSSSVIICFLIILNLFQHWQLHQGILLFDGMNADYYFKTFGATRFDEANLQLLPPDKDYSDRSIPNDTALFISRIILSESKDQDTSGVFHNMQPGEASADEYIGAHQFSKEDLSKKPEFWIQFDVSVYSLSSDSNLELVITVQRDNQVYKYKQMNLKIPDFQTGQWNRYTVTNEITDRVRNTDIIKCYVWNRDKVRIVADNIQLKVVEPKE